MRETNEDDIINAVHTSQIGDGLVWVESMHRIRGLASTDRGQITWRLCWVIKT